MSTFDVVSYIKINWMENGHRGDEYLDSLKERALLMRLQGISVVGWADFYKQKLLSPSTPPVRAFLIEGALVGAALTALLAMAVLSLSAIPATVSLTASYAALTAFAGAISGGIVGSNLTNENEQRQSIMSDYEVFLSKVQSNHSHITTPEPENKKQILFSDRVKIERLNDANIRKIPSV